MLKIYADDIAEKRVVFGLGSSFIHSKPRVPFLGSRLVERQIRAYMISLTPDLRNSVASPSDYLGNIFLSAICAHGTVVRSNYFEVVSRGRKPLYVHRVPNRAILDDERDKEPAPLNEDHEYYRESKIKNLALYIEIWHLVHPYQYPDKERFSDPDFTDSDDSTLDLY